MSCTYIPGYENVEKSGKIDGKLDPQQGGNGIDDTKIFCSRLCICTCGNQSKAKIQAIVMLNSMPYLLCKFLDPNVLKTKYLTDLW